MSEMNKKWSQIVNISKKIFLKDMSVRGHLTWQSLAIAFSWDGFINIISVYSNLFIVAIEELHTWLSPICMTLDYEL